MKLKFSITLLTLVLGFSLKAQLPTPLISYTFEHQKASDTNETYSGTLVGNASIVQMNDNNFALFTGAGYLDLSTLMGKNILSGLNGNYSVSIDICLTANSNMSGFSWAYAFSNNTTQYLGLINTAGNANWYYEIKNASTSNIKSNTGLTTSVWHNITFVQINSIGIIYVDGVAKASATVGTFPYVIANSLTGCYIGRSPFAADAMLNNAFIDNFNIYNSALTQAQVNEIYNAVKNKSTATSAAITTNITRVWESKGNPIVTHKYTADPAAFVYNDTLFIFSGQDAAGGQTGYNMLQWCCFATTDMKHFWEYSTPMKATDFTWATQNAAWAGQVVERNGKFYWYTSSNTTGIGVAVANRPEGPYKDALGKALLTNVNSPGMSHSWRTIDPSVMIDDDGQAWLYWGNGACWVAKLNADMISIDPTFGTKMVSITGDMDFPYTEAPWVHKKNGLYYLSYAAGFPERIEYAVGTSPAGPFVYKGILNEIAGNSNTNHQAIVQFKNNWYFVYHNGGIQTDGGSFSRSVCIDKLEFDSNGDYKPIIMTTKGVDLVDDSNISQVKPVKQTVLCPFNYNRTAQVITINQADHYQIVDSLGKVIKSGFGTKVNVNKLNTGVFIISNGSKSLKFVR